MTAPNVAGELDITGPYAAAGPDICRDACPLADTEHTEDACAPEVGEPRCPTCLGAGGWQQHDGAIEECPRGCMTRDGDQ